VYRHELTDAEWKRIEALLPVRTGPVSKRGDRDFVNAFIWRSKMGVSWRGLPERFGSWKIVYNRLSRWARNGVWDRLFKELAIEVDETGSLLDATTLRAHQDAAGGNRGSDAIIWAFIEEAFRPRSTRSARRKASRPASR
jgi:transposase